MALKLNGRWGPYEPKTPADKAKARKQAGARQQRQAQERAWLDKHQSCANGCGQPVAFYDDSPVPSLKYGGCCSAECQQEIERRTSREAESHAGIEMKELPGPFIKVARVYLRVSTDGQDLTRQQAIVENARAAGYYVAGVYREKASGARADRPELNRLINDLQPGEVVIAERIDRVSRLPLKEAERLVASIRERGAKLAIPGVVDLSELAANATGVTRIVIEAVQDMLLKLALQAARDDYEERRERQRQGIQLAKQAGKYRGRPADELVHERVITFRSAGRSISETARLAGCSESLVKRVWSHHQRNGILAEGSDALDTEGTEQ